MVSLAQNPETLRTEERTLDQQLARFRSLRLLLFSLLVVGLWLGYALALARVRSGLVILYLPLVLSHSGLVIFGVLDGMWGLPVYLFGVLFTFCGLSPGLLEEE